MSLTAEEAPAQAKTHAYASYKGYTKCFLFWFLSNCICLTSTFLLKELTDNTFNCQRK